MCLLFRESVHRDKSCYGPLESPAMSHVQVWSRLRLSRQQGDRPWLERGCSWSSLHLGGLARPFY